MADELAIHRSADSLSVHKARLARPRIRPEEEEDEDDEEEQPDSPAQDTEVQARVDSIALAQKRMANKKPGGLRSDSADSKPKSRFGAGKAARFADEDGSPAGSPTIAASPAGEDHSSKAKGSSPSVVTGLKNMGRKLASRLSFGKRDAGKHAEPEDKQKPAKQAAAPVNVEASAQSTHVKFTPAPAEVIPVPDAPSGPASEAGTENQNHTAT